MLAGLAEQAGCEIVAMEVVPDDFGLIEYRLSHFVDEHCDLIFTTGGTGMTPDEYAAMMRAGGRSPEGQRSIRDKK